MKRNFTFLIAAFALMVSMMMPLGMKGENRGLHTLLPQRNGKLPLLIGRVGKMDTR